MVTDNGASSTSEEFKQSVNSNCIKHVTSAPCHPSSNGLAERAVQTMERSEKHCRCYNSRETVKILIHI